MCSIDSTLSPFEPCRRTATGTNELVVGAEGSSVDVAPVVEAPVVEDTAEVVDESMVVGATTALLDEVAAATDDEVELAVVEGPGADVVEVSCPNASEASTDDARSTLRTLAVMRRVRPPRQVSVDIVISLVLSSGNGYRVCGSGDSADNRSHAIVAD